MSIEKDMATLALDIAGHLKADFADVRICLVKNQSLNMRNGILKQLFQSENYGIGVRFLKNGAWGFSSSSEINRDSVEKVVYQASEISNASLICLKTPIRLAEAEIQRDRYESPCQIDPFTVPLDDKINLLNELDLLLASVKGINIRLSSLDFYLKDQLYMNTEGSIIEQKIIHSGGGISASAISESEVQTRSYPNSWRIQAKSRGWEFIEELKLKENAIRIGEEAVQLLKARQCPQGEMDVIIGGSQLALQIHESVGHPLEFDRVIGYETNFAGDTFVNVTDIGKLLYGSPWVNIYSHSDTPGFLGSFGYDDEGTKSRSFDLIREGILVDFLTSRETAIHLGRKSNGTARAEDWSKIPLIRMTNISLKPGEWELEDLIADTKNGLFMDMNRTWSIDNRRCNFQFGCEIGWLIKNGKIVEMVKNPQYTGITTKFWNSCDAICNQKYWDVWAIVNCGKGQPTQSMRVAHGASPARFRKVKVGVGYD